MEEGDAVKKEEKDAGKGGGDGGGGERKKRKSTDGREVRYFAVDEAVCSRCGLKGHMSWDCPEPEPEVRCFICGKPGHLSKDCQREVCYYCRGMGHKAKDCPERMYDPSGKGRKKQTKEKRHFEPREIPLNCYVCNGNDHLDCSLRRPFPARLSCYNCGEAGHSGLSCEMPNVSQTIQGIKRIQREQEWDQPAGRKRRRSTAGDNPERQRALAEELYSKLEDELGVSRRSYGRGPPPSGRYARSASRDRSGYRRMR